MEIGEMDRQQVIDYVRIETHDETVEHAEKIKSERVWGTDHDVWDVHTDKHRWWVITGVTNLYSQEDFKSLDGVLSFHIGLMARIQARQQREAPDWPAPKLEQTRRQWEQAAEALNDADEAEEFQAVGMRCRETLVSFAHAMADDVLVPESGERPKQSDFVHWAELVTDAVATGSRNRRLRAYLKSEARQVWDYVAWLTHEKNATRRDAEIAVEITEHVVFLLDRLVDDKQLSIPDRCPNCRSYKVDSYWTTNHETREITRSLGCRACKWVTEVESSPLHPPEAEPEVGSAIAESDCTLTSELGPGVSQPLEKPGG